MPVAQRTYRVNTGTAVFRPFAARSIEDACAYVRANQDPGYAEPRWLQVLSDGGYVWAVLVRDATASRR